MRCRAPALLLVAAVSTQPLRILHLTAPAPVGGLEAVVASLAAGQAARGHDVTVVSVLEPGASDARAFAELPGRGVRTRQVRVAARAYLRERRAVARLIAELKPDVVHTHGYRPDLVDGPVARRAGVGTVSTTHGFVGGGWRNRLNERLQMRALARTGVVVAVSAAQRAYLRARGVPHKKIVVIPNAWAGAAPQVGSAYAGPNGATRSAADASAADASAAVAAVASATAVAPTSAPAGPSACRGEADPLARARARERLGHRDGVFHVGFIGRISHEKGADVLVEALARTDGVDASFVGDGPERARLEARVRELGLEERVRFHGMVPDAVGLMPGLDALVLSSRTEGTPMVLFEAIDAGVPVIATRVGGVPDVVTDADAWLVDPERPAQLADALVALRDAGAEVATRSESARRRIAEKYAYEPWLARYDTIYRELRGRR